MIHGETYGISITPNPMKINTLAILALITAAASFTSCVPLAVGAAAGYVAHDEGYRVENPIKKVEP
jgi:hypothetical protein